ncbi:DUF488 family protein [Specibacter sp. NPDC057265]|uniref:DUF488 domain-containing protein n=1 Tax=Specibacter sp. NPDC057265 TaxID=3346075 RepID=UPI003634B1EE
MNDGDGGRFFTIGHSNRSLDEFLELLQEGGIEQLVDVRKLPGSTKYPHFNADTLAASLSEVGIDFIRSAPLTGRRPVSKEVSFEVNAWWENRSFHNYADHALSEEFSAGLAELLQNPQAPRVALMCSEAVWWRCHRRIITDHLLAHGELVQHIIDKHQIKAAELSAGALIGSDKGVTYPVVKETEPGSP